MRLQTLISCGLSLALSGCTLIDDWGHDKPFTFKGRNLTALTGPRQLLMVGNRLVVSNGGDSKTGIAVIDTAADTVVSFHSFDYKYFQPWSIAPYQDSLLLVENQYGGLCKLNLVSGGNIGLLNVPGLIQSGSTTRTPIPADSSIYLLDKFGGNLQRMIGAGSVSSVRVGNYYTTGFATQGGKLWVPRNNLRDILVLTAGSADGAPRDSIKFSTLIQDTTRTLSPGMIVAYGGRVFAAFDRADSHSNFDSGAVAVFNASTLVLEKVIRLRFHFHLGNTDLPNVPRVVNGKWYLPAYNQVPYADGGVEVLDLNSALYEGTLLTTDQAGGTIIDFLPLSAGRGYVIYSASYGNYRIKRISY